MKKIAIAAAVLIALVATFFLQIQNKENLGRFSTQAQEPLPKHEANGHSEEKNSIEEGRPWEKTTFIEEKNKAQLGDPTSQWVISQMYDYCAFYNYKRKKWLDGMNYHISQYSKDKIVSATRNFEIVKKSLANRCNKVDDGQPIPLEAINLWLEQSAKGGKIEARIKLASLNQESRKEVLLDILNDAKKSKSPSALFEMGTLSRSIKPEWVDSRISSLFSDSVISQHAWEIAACRLGYDCSISSKLMYFACQQGGCSYDNYESYILNEGVPTGQRRDLEEKIELIKMYFL